MDITTLAMYYTFWSSIEQLMAEDQSSIKRQKPASNINEKGLLKQLSPDKQLKEFQEKGD